MLSKRISSSLRGNRLFVIYFDIMAMLMLIACKEGPQHIARLLGCDVHLTRKCFVGHWPRMRIKIRIVLCNDIRDHKNRIHIGTIP